MRYFQFLMSPIAKHHITGRPSLQESFVSGRVIDLSVDGAAGLSGRHDG